MEKLEASEGVYLQDGIFLDRVSLNGAEVGEVIADRSFFQDTLDMVDLMVTQGVLLRDANFGSHVSLFNAKTSYWVTDGSMFPDEVNLSGLEAERAVLLNDGLFMRDVRLYGAKVRTLEAAKSIFAAAFDMTALEAGYVVLLRDTTFTGVLILAHARIGGSLVATDANFWDTLNMAGALVGKFLWLQGSIFSGVVDFRSVEIDGDVDLSDTAFTNTVDASGMRIAGELKLGSLTHPRTSQPQWGENARLILRNVRVDTVQDRFDGDRMDLGRDSWPAQGNLELDGFSYKRLGGMTANSGVITEMVGRPSRWYVDWLGRDESYAPQPYQHLAGVFRDIGADEKADVILYAGRERQRSEASGWDWLGHSLLKWTIGYGIGTGYFRVLWWVFALTLIGAIILWSSPKNPEENNGFVWCMWASFDWMLPLVELDPAHTKFITEQRRWQLHWFYVQSIAGYILAAFIAAGLAGVTQGV